MAWKIGNNYGKLFTEVLNESGNKAICYVWTKKEKLNPEKDQNVIIDDEEGIKNLNLIIEASKNIDKSCKNCKYTEYQCSILKKLKQIDNGFYIANTFVEYKDFYCNKWNSYKKE